MFIPVWEDHEVSWGSQWDKLSPPPYLVQNKTTYVSHLSLKYLHILPSNWSLRSWISDHVTKKNCCSEDRPSGGSELAIVYQVSPSLTLQKSERGSDRVEWQHVTHVYWHHINLNTPPKWHHCTTSDIKTSSMVTMETKPSTAVSSISNHFLYKNWPIQSF